MKILDDNGLVYFWDKVKGYVDECVGSEGGIPAGSIVIWSGTADNIPDGWALCDGEDGRPDLRDKFVLGAGGGHEVGETGGSEAAVLASADMPLYYTLCYIIKIDAK